jgi:hypothetical protein
VPGLADLRAGGDDLVVRRMRDLRVLSRKRVAGGANDVRCLDAAAGAVASPEGAASRS